MVRSLADRTFQLSRGLALRVGADLRAEAEGLRERRARAACRVRAYLPFADPLFTPFVAAIWALNLGIQSKSKY